MNDVTELEVFYDGECPLCRREIEMVRRMDRRARVRFVDIADRRFDPSEVGRTKDELMAKIHARLADGSVIDGVETFRRMYEAVGFRRLVALTRLPGITQLLDAAYRWFAKNRLRITGRCTDEVCAPQGS